jgi:hypothetical protein
MQTHNLKMKFKANMSNIGTDGHQVKLCSSQILTPFNCKYITDCYVCFC